MAELVERHMESMTEEIEEMKRTKLFDVWQTKEILRKRRRFEYKINGVTKNLQDFKDYILHEKLLIRYIKLKRHQTRIGERISGIENKIYKRIVNLYQIGLQKFSSDFSFSLSYFKFCNESNYKHAGAIIQSMIKNFSHNPVIWKVAANYYQEKDPQLALNAIHKGLMLHKKSQILFSEAIRLEFINWENSKKEEEINLRRDEIYCEKLKAYVLSIFKNISDFKYLLELLSLLEPHEFCKPVKDIIIDKLRKDYRNEELVWDTFAQMEKNGFHMDQPELIPLNDSEFRLTRCFKMYQQGLNDISKDKKPALWYLYLDCLIDIQAERDALSPFKKNSLLTNLTMASQQIKLKEKHYIIWAKTLDEEEAKVVEVLNKGLAALPQSVELWKLKLKYVIMRESVGQVNETFKKGILTLKEKAAPLWIQTIGYHSLYSTNEILEMIYKDGIKQPKEVSEVLKPQYIKWVALWKGLPEARKVYSTLAHQQPHCKEVHSVMAELEMVEVDKYPEGMEKVLSLKCKQFGDDDVEVWIEYVRFYLTHRKHYQDKNPSFILNDKVMKIAQEAQNYLKNGNNDLLVAEFKEKYQSLLALPNL